MNDPLEQFADHYYRRRPVNATFTGMHDYDACLPDWSPTGLAALDEELRELVVRLNEQYPTPAKAAAYRDDANLLDAELARAFCEIQLSESASGHGMRGNPALWTGEAVFSVISLMIREFAPLDDRVRSAVSRMQTVPGFLEQARECFDERPLAGPWVAKALRDCEGADLLFSHGVNLWVASEAIDSKNASAARASASTAAGAFRAFADWLREGPVAPDEAMACGTAHFDLLLKRGHQSRRPRYELLAEARERLDAESGRLESIARDAGGSWPDVQERLAANHPSPEEYLAAFAREWRTCRRTIIDADVVTWPDWPIAYKEIPPFTREAAPYLYYLFYRSPAPLDPYDEYVYVVPSLPTTDPEAHLRVWNSSVIKLNHVLHHGGAGHHLQNWHAYHRAASRIGKIAAVDCANRIGMFCGGTMAEGWACYATGLMGELRGLTSLERVAEQHANVRQLARAVVDMSFHSGSMSFAEAVSLFVERTGMTRAAARAEVAKCSMFPGTAMMYWLGTQAILDLRQRLRARLGGAFSLKHFHDELLGFGSIPVPLIARMMTEDVA
jgi:hypothetical protein